MIQSGILYTVNSTGTATNVPIKNARILFKQGNTIRAQTTTNATTGAYSVDVPLGKYTVELAAGSTTSVVRAGQEFELTSSSNASTFQNWLYSKSGDINDALLKSFKDIVDAANTAAKNAQDSADEAKKTADDFKTQGIGSGELLRQGAYGLGQRGIDPNLFSNALPADVNNVSRTQFTYANYASVMPLKESHAPQSLYAGISIARGLRPIEIGVGGQGDNANLYYRGYVGHESNTSEWKKAWGESNTTVDSNGFIKRASPIIKISSKGFEHSGFTEEPICEKIGVGVYKITNTLGLAEGIEDGDWYIELPKDRYGDHYFNANLERLDDGVIIRVYERKELYFPSEMSFPDRDGNLVYAQERIVVNGNQVDLKDEWRFISLRFKEPEIIEEVEDELYSQSDNLA